MEWMLDQAFAANPDFCPAAFMLDKAGPEHKAVEAVLLRRARVALRDFIEQLSPAVNSVVVDATQLAKARARLQQREAREAHLENLATGATR